MGHCVSVDSIWKSPRFFLASPRLKVYLLPATASFKQSTTKHHTTKHHHQWLNTHQQRRRSSCLSAIQKCCPLWWGMCWTCPWREQWQRPAVYTVQPGGDTPSAESKDIKWVGGIHCSRAQLQKLMKSLSQKMESSAGRVLIKGRANPFWSKEYRN